MRFQVDDPSVCVERLAAAGSECRNQLGAWLPENLVIDLAGVSTWPVAHQVGALRFRLVPFPERAGRLLATVPGSDAGLGRLREKLCPIFGRVGTL